MDTPQPTGDSKRPATASSAPPTWVIMPILAHPEYTRAAIADVLAQSVPVRLLLINQGVDQPFREELEQIAEADDRVLLWSHQPPLPSLAASWNAALDFVWALGGEVALVVNNDVRLRQDTVEILARVCRPPHALFVSCVGVRPEQFDPADGVILCDDPDADQPKLSKGGPDFSCFLIARECHERYRFDEGFTPAFCEDCSYHRELMLAGEGSRIFSINLPYLHYGSATLKTVDEAKRTAINRAIEAGSRAHYARMWGGPPNHERYVIKGDPSSARDGVTNPELQAAVADPGAFRALIGDGKSSATPSSTAGC